MTWEWGTILTLVGVIVVLVRWNLRLEHLATDVIKVSDRLERAEQSLASAHQSRMFVEERVWNLEHRPSAGPYR